MESPKSFYNLLLCSISYSLLPLVMNAIKHLFQDYLEKKYSYCRNEGYFNNKANFYYLASVKWNKRINVIT